MKKVLNISVIFVSILLMALSCEPEDIAFNVSKTVGQTYLVEVTKTTAGYMSEKRQGRINLQDNEAFNDYKDDFVVQSINEMYLMIEPAEGETSVIGTAEVQSAYLKYDDMSGTVITKELPNSATLTLTQLATVGKVDIKGLFTQAELDVIIEMFNFGTEFKYEVGLEMDGEAPIKFHISYFVDITSKVTPL
ncbi:hypothetical protein R9C00_27785 [Flammeovirgaceae bacterium SG7u.111]|nr:hypothetical protein [Flammeovirgaceae bacterium SG7u.132]WPO35503.1 hypothetical protein R9C00_27785 [Flammeovirgaceae bacterium SG7u.111]